MDEKDFINKIVECNPLEYQSIECGPVGCINRNFCSSLLFIFPAIYAYKVNYNEVMYGSIICLFTSISHHYYKTQHKLLRIIDIICVNSIALYFVYQCLTIIGFTFYANLMYLSAFIALIFFIYIRFKPHFYECSYFWVHIFAILGIMFYIKAHDELKSSNVA